MHMQIRYLFFLSCQSKLTFYQCSNAPKRVNMLLSHRVLKMCVVSASVHPTET